ncbi:MAG: CinA family protein [Desulfurellaceae bacterium]|nr:CinA family protein [Desulfurellaceae bacterium]
MQNLTLLGRTVGELLKTHSHTIAVAESSAGGLISAALLTVPGASAYFLGGGVIYTHEARRSLLAMPDEALEGIRASTEEYALRLARQVRERFETTWGLSETGATGPTGNRYGDAAGHACFAIVGPVEETLTLETGSPDREANMWTFTQTALDLLARSIQKSTV